MRSVVMALCFVAGCGGSPNQETQRDGVADLSTPGSSNNNNNDGSSSDAARAPIVDAGSGDSALAPNSADLATTGGGALTANQKAVAEAMTSIWENDTPKLDYAYSENINDGRGYTSGRAGFCTGTGDAIQVIDCYDKLRTAANGNLMAKYMPALTTINNKYNSTGDDQGDTSSLDAAGNWVNDWGASYNTTATRADFKSCQDQISDVLYYTPAMDAATKYGLATALTRAALYDMWINQGDDTLVTATNKALGVTAKIGGGVTEDQWLQKFIELRRDVLAKDSTWKDSVDRVAGYEKARRRANWDLSKAVDSAVKASQCWPTGGYLDSQYSSYVINPDGTWATTTMASGCN
jgi:chitosanase